MGDIFFPTKNFPCIFVIIVKHINFLLYKTLSTTQGIIILLIIIIIRKLLFLFFLIL